MIESTTGNMGRGFLVLAMLSTTLGSVHARHSNSTCDKHNGQCCHHACKMTNWPCCHHGKHCCCGGIQHLVDCSSDSNPPWKPLPVPPMAPSPPTRASRQCCFFEDFAKCDAAPGRPCQTVQCVENVTCPTLETGQWCNGHEWRTSCRMNWTTGCSCTIEG
eukprot:TRINITY_DN50154_c0_g1_i2.p1 TRINITY_DN50154_c0_g1~~TRINITY_DN50154_c0_g1_i2.p1  ORF type:complete len:161 (+),score=19.59 TRINITY_DN50154_c0_g1_i2:212-694(+)